MSSVKGRGRNRHTFIPTAEGLKLPPLGPTEDSIMEYCAAVNVAVATGQLDPRTSEALIKSAAVAGRVLKQKRDRSEIDELKAMLAEAREAELAGIRREISDRRHQTEPCVPSKAAEAKTRQ